MSVTSLLVPLVGVIVAPILARAFDPQDRGVLAAAIAPATLMLAVATLGLPDALTFHLAKRPAAQKLLLRYATVLTIAVGLLFAIAVWLFLPFLSAGSHVLAQLILVAASITVPGLVVNIWRGAAVGLQQWNAVALERVVQAVVRLAAFGLLFVLGLLSLPVAVAINVLTPLLAGLVYVPLLLKSQRSERPSSPGEDRALVRQFVRYGSNVWLGSIASMLLARASQLLMVPLSSARDLGLFSVAITIADLPLVLTLAVQPALFGVNSRRSDPEALTQVSRLMLLLVAVGCTVVGLALPLLIGPVFGTDYVDATWPTVLLLVAALISVPGLMAGTALSAWGRPGLRSVGLAIALVLNLGVFVWSVPIVGVYGACWSGIVSNAGLSLFLTVCAARTSHVRFSDFYALRAADVVRLRDETVRVLHAVRGALPTR